jgi:type IV pilus assembly protein PilA
MLIHIRNSIHKRMKGEKGFTLIELLVVIIIIAILAAIAIPTFLGQRQKAQDAAAKSLIRNAMTAVETYYVDNQNFTAGAGMTAALPLIEPSIKFLAVANAAAATPAFAAGITLAATGTPDNRVGYDGNATSYSLATVAASTNVFGVFVNKAAAGNTFVKKIGTAAVSTGW